MQRFANPRRIYLLAALLACQWLTACVILPLPYHRHRPYVAESYPGPGGHAPRDWRDPRGRPDRGPY
jgi:hypothetical protein